jgi:putative ATP-binding cassette transporter
MMTAGRHFFREAWALSSPYFRSEERRSACSRLAGIVALNLFQVYLLVWLNDWRGIFFNALQNYDADVCIRQFGRFCIWAAIYIATMLLTLYWLQSLQIRWRRWLTARYLDSWFAAKIYYRMQIEGPETDNPDQRIADDLRLFTQQILSLSTGLLNSIVTFVSFISILWILSGSLTIPLGTLGSVTIPGYAAIGALIYAGVGTWATLRVGRPLISLNYNQQRFEADFRYSLVRVRENAESIAFFKGEERETASLSLRFDGIYKNFIALLIRNMKLTALSSGFGQIAIIVPYLVAAPKYFSHAILFGGIQQIANSFDQVQTSLSFIVNSYDDIAELRAIMERLGQFRRRVVSLDAERSSFLIGYSPGALRICDLELSLPGGAVIQKNINLDLKSGERLLVTGGTGVGKSTLLRAVAGLWPFGHGLIASCARRPFFLPQRTYLPVGSLRAAIVYPLVPENVPPDDLNEVMAEVGLSSFIAHLDEQDNWSLRLSFGEQQRIGFARVLLYKPDLVVLDEATSALDEKSEALLYALLDTLPGNPAVISVGHRSTLRRMHNTEMTLNRIEPALHKVL